jgi:hypothetical protein
MYQSTNFAVFLKLQKGVSFHFLNVFDRSKWNVLTPFHALNVWNLSIINIGAIHTQKQENQSI